MKANLIVTKLKLSSKTLFFNVNYLWAGGGDGGGVGGGGGGGGALLNACIKHTMIKKYIILSFMY